VMLTYSHCIYKNVRRKPDCLSK